MCHNSTHKDQPKEYKLLMWSFVYKKIIWLHKTLCKTVGEWMESSSEEQETRGCSMDWTQEHTLRAASSGSYRLTQCHTPTVGYTHIHTHNTHIHSEGKTPHAYCISTDTHNVQYEQTDRWIWLTHTHLHMQTLVHSQIHSSSFE